MFVPNHRGAFGSTYKDIKVKKLHRFAVKLTRWNYLDKPSQRCSNSGSSSPNTMECIGDYVEDKIGCRANIQAARPARGKPSCSSVSQGGKSFENNCSQAKSLLWRIQGGYIQPSYLTTKVLHNFGRKCQFVLPQMMPNIWPARFYIFLSQKYSHILNCHPDSPTGRRIQGAGGGW